MRANYTGFVGLNTDAENFSDHVMTRADVAQFMGQKNAKFDASYAYPENVAGGFQTAPIFSAGNIQEGVGFNLIAQLATNRRPKNTLQFFACICLPRNYEAEDRIDFVTDDEHGFGEGTCRINSLRFTKANGSNAWLANKLLAVQNRPALFLRVFNHDGSVNPDVVIFFPDHTEEATHKAVQYGEAFVFVRQGVAKTAELKQAILNNFNYLVKKSYGDTNGLTDVNEHTPLMPQHP